MVVGGVIKEFLRNDEIESEMEIKTKMKNKKGLMVILILKERSDNERRAPTQTAGCRRTTG